MKNFREVDEDHNYVKARRSSYTENFMGTRETRKQQQYNCNKRCCVPQKKKYDLLKEKKAAFGGKKGAVLTATAAVVGAKAKRKLQYF